MAAPPCVARVGEQVGRAPQQLRAGPLLVAQGVVGQRVEVRVELARSSRPPGRRRGRGSSSSGRRASDELEGDGHLLAGGRHRVPGPASSHGRSSVPIPNMSTPGPGERVPQADADPEVVLHPLAEHQPVGLVDPERERIGRVEAAERDRPADLGEELLAHASSLLAPSPRRHSQFVRLGYIPRPAGSTLARNAIVTCRAPVPGGSTTAPPSTVTRAGLARPALGRHLGLVDARRAAARPGRRSGRRLAPPPRAGTPLDGVRPAQERASPASRSPASIARRTSELRTGGAVQLERRDDDDVEPRRARRARPAPPACPRARSRTPRRASSGTRRPARARRSRRRTPRTASRASAGRSGRRRSCRRRRASSSARRSSGSHSSGGAAPGQDLVGMVVERDHHRPRRRAARPPRTRWRSR